MRKKECLLLGGDMQDSEVLKFLRKLQQKIFYLGGKKQWMFVVNLSVRTVLN